MAINISNLLPVTGAQGVALNNIPFSFDWEETGGGDLPVMIQFGQYGQVDGEVGVVLSSGVYYSAVGSSGVGNLVDTGNNIVAAIDMSNTPFDGRSEQGIPGDADAYILQDDSATYTPSGGSPVTRAFHPFEHAIQGSTGVGYIEISGLDPNTDYDISLWSSRNLTYDAYIKYYDYNDASNRYPSDGSYYNHNVNNVIQPYPLVVGDMPKLTITSNASGVIQIGIDINSYALLNYMEIRKATASSAPTFDWAISTSSDIETGLIDQETGMSDPEEDGSVEYTYVGESDLGENTQYYWGVKENGADWSTAIIQNFTTLSNDPTSPPTLTNPSNGDTDVELQPTFQWSPTDGATEFNLHISKSPTFDDVDDIIVNGHTSTSYTPTSNLDRFETTYYWRVQSIVGEYISDWVSANFVTIYGIPDDVTVISPSNGDTGIQIQPTLNWNEAGGADRYYIDLYATSDPSTLLLDNVQVDSPTTNYTLQITLDYLTEYTWRIRSWNSSGYSENYTTQSFTTVSAGIPDAPVLVSPDDSETSVYVKPTFEWQTSSGATEYILQISNNSSFSTGGSNYCYTYNLGNVLTFEITDYLLPGTNHYWHVAAKNEDGTGAYSSYRVFTTQDGVNYDTPTLNLPSDNAINQPSQPSFDWSDVSYPETSGDNYADNPATSEKNIQEVVITFQNPIGTDTYSVNKCDLKYDKPLALSVAWDDSNLGQETIIDQIEAGSSYRFTDGCGNTMPFRFALAVTVAQGATPVDRSETTAYLDYEHMLKALSMGWALADHGYDSGVPSADQIWLNQQYHKMRVALTPSNTSGILGGFEKKTLVGVNGDLSRADLIDNYPTRWYNIESNNGVNQTAPGGWTDSVPGYDIADATPLTTFRYCWREWSPSSTYISQAISQAQSLGRGRWYNLGAHDESRHDLMTAYGATGTDEIWTCSSQELIEYILVRDNIIVNYEVINDNQIKVTFDTSSIPDNLRWYGLSFKVVMNSLNPVTNIDIVGGVNSGNFKNSSSYSDNGSDESTAFINLHWRGGVFKTRDEIALEFLGFAQSSNTDELRAAAQCAINMMDVDNPNRATYQSQLDTLGDMGTYDGLMSAYTSGFDPGNIIESTPIDYNPEDLPIKYEFQISPNSDLSNPLSVVSDLLLSEHDLTVELSLKNTDYWWTARAANEIGSGSWATSRQLTTEYGPPENPTLTSPISGITNVELNANLQWACTGEVESYSVQLSTVNGDFSAENLLIDETGIANQYLDLSGYSLNYNQTYYWRVQSHNTYGDSDWVETNGYFTTVNNTPDPPGTPVLSSPSNGAQDIDPDTDQLSWLAASDAETYRVQISEDQNFLTGVNTYTDITNLYLALSGLGLSLKNTTYYWRVAGENTESGIGSYSSIRNFTTIYGTPELPTLTSPLNNAQNVALNESLQWSCLGEITNYSVQVSTVDGDFSSGNLIIDETDVSSQLLNLSAYALNYNQTYYWHVQSHNIYGDSDWTSQRLFVTAESSGSQEPVLTDGTIAISASPTENDFGNNVFNKLLLFNTILTPSEIAALSINPENISFELEGASQIELTSGTLTPGKKYRIKTYVTGDNFTNIGGANITGNEFVATGTTPTTWTNLSVLVQIGEVSAYFPSGAGHNTWLDKYGENHGMVSGATLFNVPANHKEQQILITESTSPSVTPPAGYSVESIAIKTTKNLTAIAAVQSDTSDTLLTGKTLDGSVGETSKVYKQIGDHKIFDGSITIEFTLTGNGSENGTTLIITYKREK